MAKRKQLNANGGLLRLSKASMKKGSTQKDEKRFGSNMAVEPEYSFDQLISIYETNNTARKCVDLYANNVVAGGWDIVPDGQEGKENEREELLDFFSKPNPETTLTDLIKEMVIDKKVTGNGAIEVARAPLTGLPDKMYNMPIATVRVADGRNKKWRTGQRFIQNEEKIWNEGLAVWYNRYYPNPEDRTADNGYDPELNGAGKETNEVMFFTEANPKSRHYGQSPSVTLLRNYLLTKYAEEFNINEFENGLLSKVIISISNGNLTDDSMAALNEFMDDLVETRSWSSIPILTLSGEKASLKVDRISGDVKEGSYIELMKYNREEVYVAYGVPPILLGIVENATLSNQSAQERKFFEKEIMPLQEAIAYRFTRMIKEDFGYTGWKFEFTAPDFRDKVQEADMATKGVQDGSLSINEKREIMGYEPLMEEDGKTRLAGAEKHVVYTMYGPIPVEDLAKLTSDEALTQIGVESGKQIVSSILNLRNSVTKSAEAEKVRKGIDNPEDAIDGDYPMT